MWWIGLYMYEDNLRNTNFGHWIGYERRVSSRCTLACKLPNQGSGSELHGEIGEVRDDPKLLGDSGHGWRISEWSGWRFDSSCEIFSPLDGKELVR